MDLVFRHLNTTLILRPVIRWKEYSLNNNRRGIRKHEDDAVICNQKLYPRAS